MTMCGAGYSFSGRILISLMIKKTDYLELFYLYVMILVGIHLVVIHSKILPSSSSSLQLKVGSCSFESIIILLIYFLNCRKALFTRR